MARTNRKIAWIVWMMVVVCILSGCGPFTDVQRNPGTLVPTESVAVVATPTPVGEEITESLAPSSTPVTVPTPDTTPELTQTPVRTQTAVPSHTPVWVQTLAPTLTASAKTPTEEPTETPVSTPTPTQGTVTVTQAPVYCRTVLTSSQRAAYDTIVAGVSNLQSIKTDSKLGSGITVSVRYQSQSNLEQEIATIVETIIMDHPELFHILNQYVYSYSGSQMTSITVQTLSKTEALSLKASVENGIQSYLQQVRYSQDQYEISKQLYELLATNVLYSSDNGHRAHSIVGAFVDGEGVCETYAKAYQLLLNRYGIRAFTVSGDGSGEAHRWIAMEINGRWYYSDPTWGDLKTKGNTATYPKAGYLRVNYTYLHLTAGAMGKDHTLDALSAKMTAGLSFTATEDNYFVKEQGYFQSMDRSRIDAYIKTQIGEALANQAETFGIQLGDAATYQAMRDYLYHNLYRLYHEVVPRGSAQLTYYYNDTHCTFQVCIS